MIAKLDRKGEGSLNLEVRASDNLKLRDNGTDVVQNNSHDTHLNPHIPFSRGGCQDGIRFRSTLAVGSSKGSVSLVLSTQF